MQECEAVAEDEPIRQGDIFVSKDESAQSSEILVIVTADCDFAQNKVGTHSVALPAVPSVEYTARQWKLRKCSALDSRIRELRRALLERIFSGKYEAMGVDLATADKWFAAKSVEEICNEISADGGDRKKLEGYCDALEQTAKLGEEEVTLNEAVSGYYLIVENFDLGINPPKVRGKIADLEAMIKEDRADFFYLNHVAGEDGLGWHIDLRDIRLVPVKELTGQRRVWLAGDCRFLRKGRLKDVYKYALTQKFGALFSRIGLPEVHEEWKPEVTSTVSAAAFAGNEGNV